MRKFASTGLLWLLTAVGVFYFPQDLADREGALKHWYMLAAMVSQTTFLTALCVFLVAWVTWIEFRPVLLDKLGRGGISFGTTHNMIRAEFGQYLYRGAVSARWGLVLEDATPFIRRVSKINGRATETLNANNPMRLPWAGHKETQVRVVSEETFGILKYDVGSGNLAIHSATKLPSFPQSEALELGEYELLIEVMHSKGVYRRKLRFRWDGDPRTIALKSRL